MKQATIKEFANSPDKYLKSLPLQLTRYGKAVAIVSTLEGVTQHFVNSSTNVTQHSEKAVIRGFSTADKTTHNDIDPSNVTVFRSLSGKCGLSICKYVGDLKEAIYTEWDFEKGEEHRVPMNMCPKHAEKYAK